MAEVMVASVPYWVAAAATIWAAILFAPWRPWGTRETLAPHWPTPHEDLGDITALIPARNEAAVIARTLQALVGQGRGLKIVVVDDQSLDGTARVACAAINANAILNVVAGQTLPAGWTGKLWALEQGRQRVATRLTLLLDADIELQPGILAAAAAKLRSEDLALVSLMAAPRMHSTWEKLLMPAFVYFFKLLYPFRLSNARGSHVAAAAGGFVLVETEMLERIGGFVALRGELIDDCALARRVKSAGGATWLGLSLAARSQRVNDGLSSIWGMVARTAFTQLWYSKLWLGICTLVMGITFGAPVAGLLHPSNVVPMVAATILAIMMFTYLPTLRFYARSPFWALALPLVGTLYLAMTWASAIRYWRGRRACWKGRTYRGKPA